MADPRTDPTAAPMELLKTYGPEPTDDARPLDQVYAEKESDIRWRASLLAESPTNQLAETGAGAATPEQVGAIPVPRGTPKQPSAFAAGAQAAMRTAAEVAKSAVSALLLPPGTPEQPSALGVGAQAAMRTAAEAAKGTMEGLGKAFLPGVAPGGVAEAEVAKAGTRGPVAQFSGEVAGGLVDKVAGVKQALMEGVLSLGMAPFVGLGAGAGQALENANPELAATEVMDPFQASFVRMMTGQGNPLDRDESPEGQARRAALHQPMTLREAVDLALTTSPIWVPVAIGAAKAGVRQSVRIRQRMKEQLPNILSERGSLTPGGEPPPDLGARLDLNNPDSIAAFVHTHGGLAHDPALAGEFKRIPLDLKRKGGAKWDVIAQQAGVDPQEFLNALTNLEVLRRQKRERLAEAKRVMDQEWEGYEPSEQQLAEQKATQDAIDLWDAMEAESAHGQPEPTGGPAQRPGRQAAGAPSPGAPGGGAGGGEVPGETLPGGAVRASSGGAAAAGPEVGAPGTTSRLNVGRVNAPERVKALLTELNEAAGRTLEEHRRPITHEQTVAEGRALSLDQIMLADPALTSIEGGRAVQQGLRDYLNATGRKLDALIKAGDDPEAVADLTGLGIYLARLDERFGAGFARGLEARKILSEAVTPGGGEAPTKAPTRERTVAGGLTPSNLTYLGETVGLDPVTLGQQAAQQAAREGAKTASVAELVIAHIRAQLDQAVSPEALLGALRKLTKPQRMTWMQSIAAVGTASRDMLHLLYVNSLLSDPTTTHAANVLGTAIMLPWELATRQLAGIIHAFSSNDPAGVQLGEAMAMVRGLARASQKGIEMASARMRDGLQPFEHASEHGPITAERYGFDPNTGFGKFVGTVGASLEGPMAPVTLMGAEDAYFKGLNAYIEIDALALRNAMRDNPTGTPAEIQAAAAKLAAVPTAEMWAEAKKQANIRTLNNELGPAGMAIANAIDKIPLGRWVIPFKRTPMNAASWFSANTVFLQLISAKLYKDIFSGSAADREMALARVALGTGVGLAIAGLVHQGVITGDGITDAVRRRFRQFTDWPVNTIEVIDRKRYSYDRLDPVAGMVGAIATFEEMRANIPPDQAWADWMGAHIGVLSLAAGSVFVSKTYMQTLSNLLDDLKHPENFGSKFQQGLARSIVPTVVRHGATAYGGNVVRSVNSMLDAIKSGIPFYRDGIPPDRHPLTGAPIVYPPGLGGEFLQAIKVYSPTGDPVVAQIDENKVRLTPVPWYVAGRASRSGPRLEEPSVDEGVRLTPEERDRWGELVGTTTAGGDKTLYKVMKETVTSDAYATWPPPLREKTLTRIYNGYRKAALAQLEEESQGKPDGILARVTAQMVKRGEMLTVNETPMPLGPSRPPAARAAPVPAGAGAPTPAPAATLSPIPPPDLLKSLGR